MSLTYEKVGNCLFSSHDEERKLSVPFADHLHESLYISSAQSRLPGFRLLLLVCGSCLFTPSVMAPRLKLPLGSTKSPSWRAARAPVNSDAPAVFLFSKLFKMRFFSEKQRWSFRASFSGSGPSTSNSKRREDEEFGAAVQQRKGDKKEEIL